MDAKLGNGTLEILRLFLVRQGVTTHPLIDLVEGRISSYIYTPNLLIPGTNLLKFKWEVVN